MTQTFRKSITRNIIRISSDPQCRFGHDIVITKNTLGDLIRCYGADNIPANALMAMAGNSHNTVYETSAHYGIRSEWHSSYKEARDYIFSQFC